LPRGDCSGRAAGFDLQEPRPGVYVHVGRPLPLDAPGHDDIANISFVVGEKCTAVIDTGGSMSIGRRLRAALEKHTAVPVCYVINTHVHVDHVLGNGAFKSAAPSFVGHSNLAAAIDSNRVFFMKEYAGDMDAPASADQIVGPDRLVEHAATLDLGGRLLQLRAWPKAHTDCDLTVYDAKTGTLWMGDLLFRERLPALDGSLAGWLAALDELGSSRATLMVPGHGALARGADAAKAVAEERRYLLALAAGVHEAISRNESLEDAIHKAAAAEKPRWLLWEQVHPHNVVRAYQEMEWQ
jgi:quinoprotein relay system zinc metallohydrolase 2